MLFDRYGRPLAQAEPESESVEGSWQTPTAAALPLTSVTALYSLSYLVGDHRLVNDVVRAYRTWDELAAAPQADLAYRVGVWAAGLRVPPLPAPFPDLSPEIRVITRYDDSYPTSLLDLPDAPVLLYVRGEELPTGPHVAVGGAYYPSSSAMDMIRAVVHAAVSLDLVVSAVLDSGCGHLALEETVRIGGRAVAVAACDLAAVGGDALLARRVMDLGGAVVSEWGPGEAWTGDRTFPAARIPVGLAPVAVLPEVGSHPTGGSQIARHAVALGRYLVVPQPLSEAETPFSGGGTVTLAKASNFREEVFGTGPRIQARLRTGHAPADAVVANLEQITAALADATGVAYA